MTMLWFKLPSARIRARGVEGACKGVAELKDEIRRPYLDTVALAEIKNPISGGDLEAARLVSTLADQLQLVRVALRLASIHRDVSDQPGNRLDQNGQDAISAIHLAIGLRMTEKALCPIEIIPRGFDC